MNYKKIANKNFEEIGCTTTRSSSRHGPGRHMSRAKRRLNRIAKKIEHRRAIEDASTAY